MVWLRVGLLARVPPWLDVTQPRLQHLNTEAIIKNTLKQCISMKQAFCGQEALDLSRHPLLFSDKIMVIVRLLIYGNYTIM